EFPDIQAAYEQLEPQGLRMLGVSLRETPLDAASYAARNGATFLVLSDPDERDTGAAYPIYNFPTHIFIDADGVIRSIVLEDMDTEQALAEARRVLGDPELARATD
ncbi:MAG: alkyl hydroperoxide reductase/Thiol specific antioxidant/Mal allergen, partial [Thermomicrobiales bacterium]|nr:alkyl hydroperoxide reductase/Thiol specific antioxidant/Mal allergen [Thermomicrobiales bacterium]